LRSSHPAADFISLQKELHVLIMSSGSKYFRLRTGWEVFNMRTFKNRQRHSSFYLLVAAIALAFIAFPLITQSAKAPHQTVTSKPVDSPANRVDLYQALLDLTNPWTVMCVAAHPDDEDGTSLIVMRHKYGAHTVSLFSTFGEGGQNAIGPELYEELGAIRARETMAAAEIQGSEPHFLGLKDFGFSKTRDEAFRFWGHEEGLRRMVLEIRRLRPDVIITNHATTSNDHGQHQATALMVVEAFDAAADPTKFPEQLKDGITTWQVQRLFVRQRGTQAPSADVQIVSIDPNEADPVRGTMFAEQALAALQKHATQGPWPKSFAEFVSRFRAFSGQGGTGQMPLIRYRLERQAKGAGALTRDSRNFLDGLELPAAVAQQLPLPDLTTPADGLKDLKRTRESIIETYRKGNYSAPASGMADPQRRELMREKMERAAAIVAGLQLNPELPANNFVPNSTINVPIKIVNTGNERLTVLNCGSASPADNVISNRANYVKVNHSRLTTERALSPGASATLTDAIQIPGTAKINVPLAQHLYEPTGLGLNLNLRCEYEIDKTKLGIDLPLRVDIAPPVEIANISPAPLALSPAHAKPGPASFTVTIVNHQTTPFDGRLMAAAGTLDKWPISTPLRLQANEKKTIVFRYIPPAEANLAAANSLSFWVDGLKIRSPRETVRVFSTNAATAANLRVGYIRGFDFSLPNALDALGVESKELSVDDVKTTDLSKFTSVIVDNRVYESKPELIAANQKLLDYANAGGNLIVFYHKNDEWNPDPRRNRPQLAPYKLILGNERVTVEEAPITFIEPDHPLLNTPNKLNQDDFKDWIQERGLYYPKEWDPQFHALLQSNDPGEAPLKGGLLVADYGRGHYIYTSMVWYRELRGGVPGAYRMLANMISYGR
jgi:LmbE family N-acetylglucosaminyl deacetylase